MKSTDDDADVSNMDTEESFQLTSRSKTKKQVQEVDLDRKRASAVRKRLPLSYTILHYLKPKIRMKKRTSDPVIMSKFIKNIDVHQILCKESGDGRQKIRDSIKKRKVKHMSVQFKQQVKNYLERPDNSATLPGKKDTKTIGKEVKQIHVLNDYMLNLYDKFKLEKPDIKISKKCFSN